MKEFNIVIVGVGGQGLITLLQIIAQAAMEEKYDVKTSELHGLSQRGGSVEVHIRFGKKIFSPLISQDEANLILGLEMQEPLRAIRFANPETAFFVNKFAIPIPFQASLSEKQILANLEKTTKDITLVNAAEICAKELGTNVVAGIYLLCLASFREKLPLKPKTMIKAIKKVVPKKYFQLNKKAFELARENAKI